MKAAKLFQSIDLGVLKLIALSTLCCLGLLIFRIKYTQSIYFLFLVWNLFLAFVPLSLTSFIRSQSKLKKWKVIILLAIWLLFFTECAIHHHRFISFKKKH